MNEKPGCLGLLLGFKSLPEAKTQSKETAISEGNAHSGVQGYEGGDYTSGYFDYEQGEEH